jgi:Flp pilus assembly protein TadD
MDLRPAKAKSSAAERRVPLWVLAAIPTLLTAFFYLPMLKNGFVNWDDPGVVEQNLHIRSLSLNSIQWWFSNFYKGFFIPLTWFSLALDYRIGGLDPWFFHLHNLFLHLVNTTLVFFLGMKLFPLAFNEENSDGKAAWVGAASMASAVFFGLHPLHVEPVAWVTGRKDLLCGMFCFASLLVYLDYGTSAVSKYWKLALCFGFFVLALLSKPMAVTLPFVLIILDGWPLKRLKAHPWKCLAEKIPFYLLMVFACASAIAGESDENALASLKTIPWGFRVMNAFHSLLFYLEKTLAPFGLSALYPIRLKNAFSATYVISALLVFLGFMICFWNRKKHPNLPVMGLFYALTLAPTLGFIAIGGQAAADRYFYIPSLGIFLGLGAFLPWFFQRRIWLGWGLIGFLTAFWGVATWGQVSYWHDSISLWEHVLKTEPRNSSAAYSNLGEAYRMANRMDESINLLNTATKFGPLLRDPHNAKGKVLFAQGAREEAAQEFNKGIELDPQNGWALSYLDVINSQKGERKRALAERRAALVANPDDAWSHLEDAFIYRQFGVPDAAREQLQMAVKLDPNFAEAFNMLGGVFCLEGNLEKSTAAYQRATHLEPQNRKFSLDLADAYFRAGNFRQAEDLYLKLSRLD